MNPNKLFPLIVTRDLARTRAFYESLGFELSFELPGYAQFRYGSDPSHPEIGFMSDGGPEQAPFEGRGLIVSVPTENADATHARYAKMDLKISNEPEDHPWGWRSFHVLDPNGIVLDFFHVIGED